MDLSHSSESSDSKSAVLKGWKQIWAWLILLSIILLLLGSFLRSENLCRTAGVVSIFGFLAALPIPELAGYRFTFWILLANMAALLAPQWFIQVNGFSLTDSWLLLIVVQAIMFGMGTQMSFRDFAHVAMMPKGVLVGLSCQFLIMPMLGYSLSKVFLFPPEIAAGMILIGSCSSGLASNVMTYLAKGNLPLSVTMTAIATMLAPILTPMWMYLLAGSLISVDPLKMSLDIVKMVLVPIMAAFVHDWLTSYGPNVKRVVYGCFIAGLVWLVFLACGGWNLLQSQFNNPNENFIGLLSLPGFVSAAIIFGVFYHFASISFPRVEKWMPIISMIGIVYFTVVTTAKGRDQLLEVGVMLLIATFFHNVLGYALGFWGSRLLGMNRQDARTIAIEVGLQNGAMATGLAKSMGKLETVGLAGMIFGPLMNITGSVLANYWRKTSDDIESPNQ